MYDPEPKGFCPARASFFVGASCLAIHGYPQRAARAFV